MIILKSDSEEIQLGIFDIDAVLQLAAIGIASRQLYLDRNPDSVYAENILKQIADAERVIELMRRFV